MVKSIIRTAFFAAILGFAAVPAVADDLEADGSAASSSSDSDWSWSSSEESGSHSDDYDEDGGSDGSCYGDTDVTRC